MGIKKNADASYNLGLGVSDANDYKGFAGQNEITIQLTADGATDKSMDALNYLKTFAINQAAAGLPIKPSASVSISANGYTKALEADDFEITETGVKIGGIEYTTSTDSWDFTNALVPSGGGGGLTPLIVNIDYDEETETLTLDKTYNEIRNYMFAGRPVYIHNEYDVGTGLTTIYIPVQSIGSSEDSTTEPKSTMYIVADSTNQFGATSTDGYPQSPFPSGDQPGPT